MEEREYRPDTLNVHIAKVPEIRPPPLTILWNDLTTRYEV